MAKNCFICGNTFTPKVSNQITCSIDCRLYNRKLLKAKFDSKKKNAICISCGVSFEHPASSKRFNCSDCLSIIRSENKKGSKNVHWKGGVSVSNRTEKQNFMSSLEWKKLRKKVFERDDYTCQLCFARGGTLNADHIKPYLFFPDLRLKITNIRTLCVSCHRKTDTYGCKVHKIYA